MPVFTVIPVFAVMPCSVDSDIPVFAVMPVFTVMPVLIRIASIPGRVFAFITVSRLTVIKTRPGIEASVRSDASVYSDTSIRSDASVDSDTSVRSDTSVYSDTSVRSDASVYIASRLGRLKYGLVSIAWVIVHMRELSYPESG